MSEVANIPQLRFPGFSDEWEERPLKDVSTFLMERHTNKLNC